MHASGWKSGRGEMTSTRLPDAAQSTPAASMVSVYGPGHDTVDETLASTNRTFSGGAPWSTLRQAAVRQCDHSAVPA